MTSPNRRLSLDEVLELFFMVDKPTPSLVRQACDAHPEYRSELMEFAALWTAYQATPEPESESFTTDVSDEEVAQLQSFVMNRLHALNADRTSNSDLLAADAAVKGLSGGKQLKRAAIAAGLGESTLLLMKVLAKRIIDVPVVVQEGLARHLGVRPVALKQTLGLQLTGPMSYKASDKPNELMMETWEHAVKSLSVPDDEKARLLALQSSGDSL
jgi:hypothetical protein